MSLGNEYFSEVCEEAGSAFSLKVKQKLHEEQSDFQHIAIYETENFGNLMVIDGFVMLSQRDNFLYHEMMSHVVLFTHPEPKDVLIIGGGDCGTLKEVLKHDSVTSVLQIEIDERVTRLAEEYFPELCTSNNDSRADIRFIDGIQWVKDTVDNSYDIIIIDSTDPIGPAEGLFTEPFYKDCVRVLRDDGVLVQQSESPLLHMRILESMYRDFEGAGFNQVQTAFFPQMVYPSGWWSGTMASAQLPLKQFRQDDVKNKKFKTEYYNLEIHQAALAQPEFFKRLMSK
ncbi:MAG: polyamine aminopropyltransferase [Gammaproteobacteria bacterium]|nr:polyamine aminopropyltransferase [Gammaproteobacteria bacterium]MDH5729402.1 polyamine aminopropyltransferase [Gammaproteobacteria bacterium]